MKPAWDKLMKEYAGSATALIGDADCTADGKALCETIGVEGFPTIKWGDAGDLQAYEGGRDFDALSTFAKENLKPQCSPSNIDLCDADKKKEIETLQKMSSADLEAKIEEKEKLQKDAGEHFDAAVKELQATYEKLQKTKDDTIAEVKASGLGLMKAVKAAKAKAIGGEEL